MAEFGLIAIALVLVASLLILSIATRVFFQLWLNALFAGVPISLPALIAIRLRGSNPDVIVQGRIDLARAGMNVETSSIEACQREGANIPQIVSAVIAADAVGLELFFEEVAAVELAGFDIADYVQSRIAEQEAASKSGEGKMNDIPHSVQPE